MLTVMTTDCWSQYVLLFRLSSPFARSNSRKPYTLLLPRCFPDSLGLREDIASMRERMSCDVEVDLLVQIAATPSKDDAQYFKLREHYAEGLKEHAVLMVEHGLWVVEPQLIFDHTVALFQTARFPILSSWGHWRDDFDSAVQWR